jgi:CRISPR-associated protein Csa3
MIYLLTLGYDEKFAIRFLLRRSITKNDILVVVLAKGYSNDEKAVKAFDNLSSLIEKSIGRIETYEVDYSSDRPMKEISKLSKFLLELTDGEKSIYACLSGGMRSIIAITLLALLKLSRDYLKEIWMEIDFENLLGFSRFPLNVINIPRNERFIAILKSLRLSKLSVRKIGEKIGLSPAAAHRIMSNMVKIGLLDDNFRPTEMGLAYLDLYEELKE